MIVVRVELWSAVTGRKVELARMHICNDGETTLDNPRRGAYVGESFIGRSTEALDERKVSKRGRVGNWPRLDFHVWNLVARMLEDMGYDKGKTRPAAQARLL
jgi:hypothetical protein